MNSKLEEAEEEFAKVNIENRQVRLNVVRALPPTDERKANVGHCLVVLVWANQRRGPSSNLHI